MVYEIEMAEHRQCFGFDGSFMIAIAFSKGDQLVKEALVKSADVHDLALGIVHACAGIKAIEAHTFTV